MEDLFEIGELFEDALIPIAIGCVLVLVVCACIFCFVLLAGGQLLDVGEEGTLPDTPDLVARENLTNAPLIQEEHRSVEMRLIVSGR